MTDTGFSALMNSVSGGSRLVGIDFAAGVGSAPMVQVAGASVNLSPQMVDVKAGASTSVAEMVVLVVPCSLVVVQVVALVWLWCPPPRLRYRRIRYGHPPWHLAVRRLWWPLMVTESQNSFPVAGGNLGPGLSSTSLRLREGCHEFLQCREALVSLLDFPVVAFLHVDDVVAMVVRISVNINEALSPALSTSQVIEVLPCLGGELSQSLQLGPALGYHRR